MDNLTRESIKHYSEVIIKRDKTIEVLKWLLVFSIILNILVGRGYLKGGQNINLYDETMVSYTQYHLGNAYRKINYIQDSDSLENSPVSMVLVASDLESAAEYIGHYSIIYTFNSSREGYAGNSQAQSFFLSYTTVLNNWARAINMGELESIPTSEDIHNMQEDIKNMTDKFIVFDNEGRHTIKNLDYRGILNLLNILADETKTAAVKKNLNAIFY